MKQSFSLLFLALCSTFFFASTTPAVSFAQRPGQWEPIAVNDSALLESLRLVESVYLPILNAGRHSSGEYFARRGPIHSASKQLVNGLNYRATFDFYEAICRKAGCIFNCIVKRQFLCTVTINRNFALEKKVFLKNFSCDQKVVKENTRLPKMLGAIEGEEEKGGEKVGKC